MRREKKGREKKEKQEIRKKQILKRRQKREVRKREKRKRDRRNTGPQCLHTDRWQVSGSEQPLDAPRGLGLRTLQEACLTTGQHWTVAQKPGRETARPCLCPTQTSRPAGSRDSPQGFCRMARPPTAGTSVHASLGLLHSPAFGRIARPSTSPISVHVFSLHAPGCSPPCFACLFIHFMLRASPALRVLQNCQTLNYFM